MKEGEMDQSEQNLFEMLNHLWNLNQDGKGDSRGLTRLLREYKCAMVSYLGRYLKKEGWVSTNKQGRYSVVSYQSNKRPTPDDAKFIANEVRNIKNDYATSRREPAKELPVEVTVDKKPDSVNPKVDLDEVMKEKERLDKMLDTSDLHEDSKEAFVRSLSERNEELQRQLEVMFSETQTLAEKIYRLEKDNGDVARQNLLLRSKLEKQKKKYKKTIKKLIKAL